jgi:hypothetical protein
MVAGFGWGAGNTENEEFLGRQVEKVFVFRFFFLACYMSGLGS